MKNNKNSIAIINEFTYIYKTEVRWQPRKLLELRFVLA